MTADAERTITAPSEPELLAVVAALRAECVRRRAALRQVGDIRPYPGGGVFVRVRAVDRRAPVRPVNLRPYRRRGPRPVVVVGLVGVLAAATALALLAVLVFGELAAHWRPMLGVAVVVGLIALAIRGAAN